MVVVPEFRPFENPTFSTESAVLCRSSLRRLLVKLNSNGSVDIQMGGEWNVISHKESHFFPHYIGTR